MSESAGGRTAAKLVSALPFPLVQAAGDHVGQNVPAPAIFEGSLEIPLPGLRLFDPIEQKPEVPPGQ